MNPKTFEQNIEPLQKRDPATTEKLLQTSLDGMSAEWVKTKTNAPSLRILPQDGSTPVLLHSAYDPVRESSRWAEAITLAEPTNIFILGMGLGYHLLTFLKNHIQKTRYFFVIEKDPRIARLAFSTLDLRPLIQRENTVWLIDENPEEIPEIIGDRRTDIILHNFRIFHHDPSLKYDRGYYDAVQHHIIDAVTYDEVNLRTNMENRGRNQFNILMNLPSIFQGYRLNRFKDCFRGCPGIVSAAGPSLDKNVDALQTRRDGAPLFIVDTAQKTFQNRGIVPDFVVTADPTPLNFSHFEQIDSVGEAFFCFHPEVNRKITEKFSHHPYLLPLFDGESDLLEFLFEAENRFGAMDRAMNVGHIAFNLAVYMGCDPIILVGFDYAFPPKGGTTHAKDAAMSRAILEAHADGTTTIAGKENKASQETGKMQFVEGYYGGIVPTTVPFVQYIHALERSIQAYGVRVIDATEGGAAFRFTEKRSLQETLQRELTQKRVPNGIQPILQAMIHHKEERDAEIILQRLNECRQVLVQGQVICRELIRTIETWKQRIQKGTLSMDEAHHLFDRFNRRWLEMVSPPLFDAVLGTAVQYIYFRRQKSEQIDEPTGTAYLQCMGKKYDFILQEMNGLLEQFVHYTELAAAAFQTRIQAVQTQ